MELQFELEAETQTDSESENLHESNLDLINGKEDLITQPSLPPKKNLNIHWLTPRELNEGLLAVKMVEYLNYQQKRTEAYLTIVGINLTRERERR